MSPKTALLPFYNFTVGWSAVHNQASRRPFYLFTWAWYEVQNQAPRQLILSFYLCTFLSGGGQRYRISPKTAHFTFLPFYLGCSEFQNKATRRLVLPFTFLPGGD